MAQLRGCIVLVAVLLGAPLGAWAHSGPHHEPIANQTEVLITRPRNWHELLWAWEFEPWVVGPLLVTAWFYGRGVYRVWRRAGVGHGISRWEFAAFVSGWLTLVLALVSPLHPWGSVLFSAHMSQHELLMLVAAPLLVIGKPLVAFLRGMPAAWAATLIRGFGSAAWTPVWRFLTNPFVAWLIHAAVLWIWHIPSLFEATLENELVHALQHLSFVLSALLFWWAVMQGPRRAMNFGVATLYMFTTALHSGALGALLTFAKSLWYPAYAASTHDWGLSPLEDQQLGGLIMWVPACLVYLVAGLALCAGSMRESERRTERAELLRSLAEREVVA